MSEIVFLLKQSNCPVLAWNITIMYHQIQIDTYADLKDYLKHVYDVTEFAAHGYSHWPDVAPGKANIVSESYNFSQEI